MIDLKDLQKIAKNGDFSKKLLEDKELMGEFKRILKEEANVDATDEKVSDIIMNIEKDLQGKKEITDEEAEAISGGGAGSTFVKVSMTAIGALVGRAIGSEVGTIAASAKATYDITKNDKDFMKNHTPEEQYKTYETYFNDPHNAHRAGYDTGMGSGVGLVGGAYVGYKLGNLICKKFEKRR